MSILINIASEFTGKKEFKKAEKATFDLDKSVKKLGKSLGLALSTTAVVAFGKAAVKAFAEDEAAAARLSKTVDNLGLAFANPQISAFIETLSETSGVVDDQLRPAMQKLLTTTGSVIASQKLLAQSIDISRGSGVDLSTVTQDLANAYVGNIRGLRKYNLGLTQAELQAASFTTIQEKLNAQFGGSSAAFLATYAGQMQVLTTAAGEAKETIGGGLIDAFKIIAGDTTITDLSGKIATLATNIADFFRGMAQGFRDLAAMPVIKQLIQLAGLMLKIAGKVAGAVIDPFVTEGARRRSSGMASSSANSHLAGLTAASNAKASAKAETDAKKRAAALSKDQKKTTAEIKKQNALKKAGTIFDLDQIGLIAALKGQLSEEEKKRVLAQLALLAGNVSEAKRLTDEIILAQDGGKELAAFLAKLPDARNPFAYLEKYLANLKAQADAIGGGGGGGGGSTMPPETNVPRSDQGFVISPDLPGSAGSDAQFGPDTPWARAGAQSVVVQIDGRAVASALLDQSMSAGQVAYLDRRTGGF
jgi:hypothetical protein